MRFVFIVPFRNVKDYIYQCAKSLQSQNNPNWIAIFCDDASTDNTIEIINEELKDIPGKLHFGEFIDFSQARNKSLYLTSKVSRL